MKNEDELKKISDGIKNGDVTISNMVAHESMLEVFKAMRDVTLGELEDWENNGVHVVFEWHENAVGKNKDGNPMFNTYQFLTVDEWTYIQDEMGRTEEKASREENLKKRNVRKRISQNKRKKK